MIRIAVLTDDRLFAAGLLRILEAEADFLANEHPQGAASVSAAATDVLLVDSRMDGAFEVCTAVKRASGAPIILFAAPEEDSWAPDALGAGARGILPRSAGAADLVHAVRVVHDGLIWARRRVIVAWLDRLTSTGGPPRNGGAVLEDRLSGREGEVVRHAAAGLGNREISHRLAISEATVKAHLTRIFQKLGLRSRGELAAAYHGIAVPADPAARRVARRPVSPAVLESRGAVRIPQPFRRSS